MSRFVVLGAHIVDVLGRPVGEIPAGQGSELLTEIRITAAGTAAGTAVDLARLGGIVRCVGAVGTDALATFLLAQLTDAGIDVTRIVQVHGVQTSATILPIRANGERPALHVPGATDQLRAEHVDATDLSDADYLHVGGPDVLGEFTSEVLPGLLRQVRAAGVVISADLLTSARPGTVGELAPVFAQVDHLLINLEQAMMLTGERDATAAAQLLRTMGPAWVVVTTGADGGVLVDADGEQAFPALQVEVVDTTGCGDAFSAGYLTALGLGWSPRRACRLGTACAALVAQTLGSDGIASLETALRLVGSEPT